MTRRLLIGTLAMMAVALLPGMAPAQDVTAEVRTWAGQSWMLAQPSLEVFYTIVPPKPEGSGPGAAGGGLYGSGESQTGTSAAAGPFSGVSLFGSQESVGRFFDKGPEPRQGHRQTDTITLQRGGVETQVPVAKVAAMAFSRTQVAGSTLPPYVAGSHYRFGATVVLADGTRVDADYVNLGTMVLRGSTAQGRVDIPWQEIQTVRFQR